MPYVDSETSAHDGSPVEGYEFIGTNNTYRYTSVEQGVTINGQPYTPIAGLKRDAIRSGTQDDDSLELEITMPFDTALVREYAYDTSPPDLDVTVYRYHDQDNPASEFIKAWVGRVTGFSVTGKEATIRVPSIFELVMRGEVPSVYYHHPCNHVFADARCKAVQSTQATTIAVITSGTQIQVADDGHADNFLIAGEMILTSKGERRTIIDNVADLITINFPFSNPEVGDLVTLGSGCDHAYKGDCLNKYNNQLNYGGFPFTPTDNPFQGEL